MKLFPYLSLIAILTAVSVPATAQEKAPLIKGKVEISIKDGTFDCNLTLTDIPQIEDYLIFVNSGMNMRYIRNMEDNYSFVYERDYNDDASFECFGYYMENNKGKFLPMPGMQFSYTGKFPVYNDTMKSANSGDWKGNIAFNGNSVRADGRQTGWYPTLYDVKKEKMYDEVRYDVEVICRDCNSIYINGSKPTQGNTAHLKSDKPIEMMLYAGNYKWYNDGDTYFLNPDFDESEMEGYGKTINGFKSYYSDNLKIPYGSPVTYVNATPVSKRNAWLWVSYPTIVTVGHGGFGIKSVISDKTMQPFMAHELGHYYFGHSREFNSELGDMIGESFPEYLSFLVAKHVINSDSIYESTIAKKIENLKGFKATPIASIKKEADYKNRELYVYYYAPVLYLAIEKEIGEQKMWEWMKALLETKTERTNYAFFDNTLSTVLKNDKQMQLIRDKYFKSPTALENAFAKLGVKK